MTRRSWDDATYPEDVPDDRPIGYSVCRDCGADCEEWEYDECRRISLCQTCHEKEKRQIQERIVSAQASIERRWAASRVWAKA